jgi:hypothetical protein
MIPRALASLTGGLMLLAQTAAATPYSFVSPVGSSGTGAERCLTGGANTVTTATGDACGPVGAFGNQLSIIQMITDDLSHSNGSPVTLTRLPDNGSDNIFTAFAGTAVSARALYSNLPPDASFGIIPGKTGGSYTPFLTLPDFLQGTGGSHLALNSGEAAFTGAGEITAASNVDDLLFNQASAFVSINVPTNITGQQYRDAIHSTSLGVTLSSNPNDASANNGGLDHMVTFEISGLAGESPKAPDYILAFEDGAQACATCYSLNDRDYNDLVVQVKDTIDWVSEPGSLAILGASLLLLSGMTRARRY